MKLFLVVMSLITLSVYCADDDKFYENLFIKNLKSQSKDKEAIKRTYAYLANSESNNKELWDALLKDLKSTASYSSRSLFISSSRVIKPEKPSGFYSLEDSHHEYFQLIKTLMSGSSENLIEVISVLPDTKYEPRKYDTKTTLEAYMASALRFRKKPSKKVLSFLKKFLTDKLKMSPAHELAFYTLATYGTKECAKILEKHGYYSSLWQYRHKLENAKALCNVLLVPNKKHHPRTAYEYFTGNEVYDLCSNGLKKAIPYNPKNAKEVDGFIVLFKKLLAGVEGNMPSIEEKKKLKGLILQMQEKKRNL